MKIRFRVPEAGDPRREGGLSLPPQQSKRVPPRLRWILITLLALSPVIWVLLHFARAWLWMESRGYVVFEELRLQAPADGVIRELPAVGGTWVERDGLLVRLDNPEWRAELSALRAAPPAERARAGGGSPSTKGDMLMSLSRRHAVLRERTRTLRELAARGAATRGEVLAAEADELAVAEQIQAASSRLASAAAQPIAVSPAQRTEQQARAAMLSARLDAMVIRAPQAGTIDDLVVRQGQWVSRGDPLMVLRHGLPHVVAFMQGQDFRFAQPGERVSIVLPNRERIEGLVLGLAPSTRRLPEELAGSLDPLNPRLQVLIQPQRMPSDARIHRLPVVIRSFRFYWPAMAEMLSE